MNETKRYVFASRTTWPLMAFNARRQSLPGQWIALSAKEDLDEAVIRAWAPRYIFFPHWSWIVPDAVLARHECVCFHMTDVPFGRGGSPLQNLVSQGITETKLTALRMTGELDAGPVYAKRSLSLAGSAAEILARAAEVTLDLMIWIIENEPSPYPQAGEPTYFTRRKPEQSAVPLGGSINALYDHIRMLDAEAYPHAYLDYGGWHMEFTDASLVAEGIAARVLISSRGDASE